MENASDALKMAAAMLLFVGALSIAIFVLSKARQTSANIMAQKEASRSYYTVDNLSSEKEVGIDTVITNMYNYYQTQSTILFYKGTKNGNKVVNIEPISLYYTEASDDTNIKRGITTSILDKSTLRVGAEGLEKRAIYGLDIHDELTRQEPWTQNEETAKQFIDALVNRKLSPGYDISKRATYGAGNQFIETGNTYYDSTKRQYVKEYKFHTGFTYDFNGTKSLIELTDAKFVERVGIYNYEAEYLFENVTEDGTNYVKGTFQGATTDSSRIAFDETDETIENKEGEKKTVIEYIYLE